MADSKISKLDEAQSLNDEDTLVIVQNGTNKRVSAKTLASNAKKVASFSNASSVTITHNLGRHPSINAVDTAGTEFGVAVSHTSDNECVVAWNGVTSGKIHYE